MRPSSYDLGVIYPVLKSCIKTKMCGVHVYIEILVHLQVVHHENYTLASKPPLELFIRTDSNQSFLWQRHMAKMNTQNPLNSCHISISYFNIQLHYNNYTVPFIMRLLLEMYRECVIDI